MTLVFDRRGELADQPMFHALLVGVSDYPHLPGDDDPPESRSFNLKRLASPALSAWEVCRWLVTHRASLPVPLGTVRVLLAPSQAEQAKLTPLPAEPNVIQATPDPPGLVHFVPEALAWRGDAARHRDGLTFFYYSGHGLEQFGSPLVTLGDFADPLAGGVLQRAFRLKDFIDGMAPTADLPNIALSQFYFIDACRESITSEVGLAGNPGEIWTGLSGKDPRGTPVFMATHPGSVAQAKAGHPSDFCEALLHCLETAAENSDLSDPKQRWPVTSFTLNNALAAYFERIKTGQYVAPTGTSFKNIVLRWLDQPPEVDLSLIVHPDAAVDLTKLSIERFGGGFQQQIDAARPNHPYRLRAQSGIYQLTAEAGDRFAPFHAAQHINPQRSVWPVAMEEKTG